MVIFNAGDFEFDKNQLRADLAFQLTHRLGHAASFGLAHISGKGEVGKTAQPAQGLTDGLIILNHPGKARGIRFMEAGFPCAGQR